jgi:DNA-binding SARP family transcriptional activator
VRFNVLGSLEVVNGDRRVALGGLKQRAVLAALLIHAPRLVSVDTLIDELWPGEPPAQARNALQTYVSNLRRALEPDRAPRDPARILRSQPPGYVLCIDPDLYDAARFEALAGGGRALLRDGDPRAARERLSEALGLWRGPAFAEFAGEPFARAESDRLEERRAVALEDRIAAELALGEHAAVSGELAHLVADEPLREGLWAHLMLALYRSGRQGDALAAYQRCRRTLAEELGIEPSPALRRLEGDILRQASSLDWAPPAPATERPDEGRASLVHRDGGGRLHVFPLDAQRARLTVGRDATADVWVSWDVRVSRRHARLECGPAGWSVVDEGTSRNGSYVNDELVEGSRVLADGDELRVGDTVMTFRSAVHAAAVETSLAD